MIKTASLNSLGFFYLGFLMPVIARTSMNATGTQIGLIVSSLVIGFMISSTFVGYLTDRVKYKKNLIFIGSIGRGISYFLIYAAIIANSLISLWVGWFSLGLGAGFFWIPFDTLISEKSDKDHRSHAFGKRDSANAIGQLIGALFGFGILMLFGFITNNPFILYSAILIFGIANFVAGIIFLRKVDETIKFTSEPSKKNGIDHDQKTPVFPTPMLVGLAFLFIAVILSSINGNLWRPFLNIYIIENISDNLNTVILIYLPSGILATLLAPKLGQVMDNVNPLLGIIVTSSIGALLTWLMINTSNLILFTLIVLGDITIALSAGLLFRNILSRINIEHRGKILGATNFFTNLGGIIGPIMGGLLWDALGSKAPFIFSIWVELGLIPLYLLVVKLLLPHLAESYDKPLKEVEVDPVL